MSVPMVFALVFFSVFGITIGIPYLPPAEILNNLVGIPEITYDVFGFSGELLVNGIINGACWGLFLTLIYGLGRNTSKNVIIIPVKSAPATSTPTPAPAVNPFIKRPPSMARKSTSYVPASQQKIYTNVPLNKDVETIEGIGPKYGSMLRFYDIKDLADLLIAGSTGKRRRELAKKVGTSSKRIFSWVNKADFSRIKGVGSQYAGLLDATGVNTVMDLTLRNPNKLYEKVREINIERNLVKRIPPYNLIDSWIQSAKSLIRIVEY